VDGVEGVRPVMGEHHCAIWVGAEGGVDDMADVFDPALDADPELQRASDGPASGSSLMQTMAAKRSHASQMAMGRTPRLLGFSKATPLLFKRASTRGMVNASMAVTKARQVRRPAGQPKIAACSISYVPSHLPGAFPRFRSRAT
jgi:hypothetical protein